MKKKIISSLISLVPLATLVSCASAIEANRKEFDFGVAVPQINTLNYVTNNSSHSIINSLVESFFKPGPTSSESYGGKLNLPSATVATYRSNLPLDRIGDILGKVDTVDSTGRFFTITDTPLALGTAAPTIPGTSNSVRGITNPSGQFLTVTLSLNKGASKWSNGDEVVAQDFIDYILYVLNISVASPNLTKTINNINIKNSQALVSLQQDYVQRFSKVYSNPFGQRRFVNVDGKIVEDQNQQVFVSENPGDEEYVANFKKLLTNFGMYTGRVFVEYSNKEIIDLVQKNISLNPNFDYKSTSFKQLIDNKEVETKLTRNPFLDPHQVFIGSSLTPKYKFLPADDYDLRIEFEDYAPKVYFSLYRQVIFPEILLPINRKFVEYTVGGIRNFGTDLKNFIWNGPFDISQLDLGPQGSLILSKRDSYYSADKTVPEKIKVFFAEDPELLSTLFVDGYIAETKIPAIYQQRFWANEKTRQYMQKQVGFGTIAIQMNLDNVTRGNSYLQDEDLRKAIYYAINRVDLLKLYGLDSSFSQTTWTNFGSIKTSRNYPLASFFIDKKYYSEKVGSDGKNIAFNLLAFDYTDQLSKESWFESIQRVDNSYNLEVANFYLNRFRAKYPNLNSVDLKFIYKDNNSENVATGLQDILARQTNGFIKIDPIRLPDGIYTQRLITGEFDLAIRNFDFFNIGGGEPHSYIRAFFNTDDISPKDNKLTGFENNPTGSMTYYKWWSSLSKQRQEEIQKRLDINDFDMQKFVDLITRKVKTDEQGQIIYQKVFGSVESDQALQGIDKKEILIPEYAETNEEYNARINAFFNSNFTDEELKQGWNQEKVFNLIVTFEKIIREFAPVIPVMEVDTFWIINRIRAGRNNSFQYAFDVENIKKPNISPEDGK
ncbi:ABC transporter substrate-binding protein [Mesomycoplasma conjunctivae]|uniref:ABC transporter substrate-binding protein n=1 Tax=Mesomycoplasma conjunctivae TaxID=45361 RepID=UPI003DA1FABC